MYPIIHRYEEGPGASAACPTNYWVQRFVPEVVGKSEENVFIARAHKAGIHTRRACDRPDRNAVALAASTYSHAEATVATQRRKRQRPNDVEVDVWRTRDSTTFHAFNTNVQRFFELGGYV